MNCRTGEITTSPELMQLWLDRGDRVLLLPEQTSAAEYTTVPVGPNAERRTSVLLETLGIEIRDAEAEARAVADRNTLDFCRKIQSR